MMHTFFSIILVLSFSVVFAQDILLSGRVVDGRSEPVAGAGVRLVINDVSSTSDQNGHFTISGTNIINLNPLKSNSQPSFSSASGLLTFSVSEEKTPVRIDIFTPNGRIVETVLEGILDRGDYSVRPLSLIRNPARRAMYIIRIKASETVYAFRASYSADTKGRQRHSYVKSYRSSYKPVSDTLEISKTGFQTGRIRVETLRGDVGDIEILGFPEVKITGPEDGRDFVFGDSLVITADAFDRDGENVTVSFYVDSQLYYSDSVPPFTFTWNTLRHTIGSIPIKAVVRDVHGLEAMDSVSISVSYGKERFYKAHIVNIYPHDINAFTQGLVYENGHFYESTGLHGSSTLRKVDLVSGDVLRIRHLDPAYFGEGLTIWNDRLIQLTWMEGKVFVYDKSTFAPVDTFKNPYDGWGLTNDGKNLIASDGSAYLFYRDPQTFEEIHRVHVTNKNGEVRFLNELQYFYHKVFANIFYEDYIVMIDPSSGRVLATVDCELFHSHMSGAYDVLNGIAYDPDNDRIFLTGKNWPRLFEIKMKLVQ